MRSLLTTLSLATAVFSLTLSAWSAPAPKRASSQGHRVQTPTRTARVDPGRSLGSPTEGHLQGGAHLETTPYLRISPSHSAGDVRWGLVRLVQALDRAARLVHEKHPDAVLTVGHLSRRGGGEIDGHHSHESGRDADVQFYMRTRSGRPLLSAGYVHFKEEGSSPQWPGAWFDDDRNWEFVQALVSDPQTRIQRIFVADHLRARLLATAARLHAPAWIRVRAAQVLLQPKGALPHDDHFHVRIGCPPHMQQCINSPTVSHPRHAPLRTTRGGTRRFVPLAARRSVALEPLPQPLLLEPLFATHEPEESVSSEPQEVDEE